MYWVQSSLKTRQLPISGRLKGRNIREEEWVVECSNGGGKEIGMKSWTESTNKIIVDPVHDFATDVQPCKLSKGVDVSDAKLAVGMRETTKSWTLSTISQPYFLHYFIIHPIVVNIYLKKYDFFKKS